MGAQTFVDLRGADPGAGATDSLEFGHRFPSVGRFLPRQIPRFHANIGQLTRIFNR
jgi:hypothetical protein